MPNPLFGGRASTDKGVDSGQLRHYVTLERRGVATDEGGGQLKTPFAEVKKVWAAIYPAGSSETVRAQQRGIEVSHTILIRYDPAFANDLPFEIGDFRIKYGTRQFAIQGAVNVQEQSRILKLECLERLEVD